MRRSLQTYPAIRTYRVKISRIAEGTYRVVYDGKWLGDFSSFEAAIDACKAQGNPDDDRS